MNPDQQAAIVADGILTGLVRCDFYGGQLRIEFLEMLRWIVERWEDEADNPHSRLCLDVRNSILEFIKQEQMIHEQQQGLRNDADPVEVPPL